MACLFVGVVVRSACADWPERMDFSKSVANVSTKKVKGGTLYESETVSLWSDSVLSSKLVREVMVVAASVPRVVSRLPVKIGGRRGFVGSPRIRVFEFREDYHEAGGTKTTVGMYRSHENDVLLLAGPLIRAVESANGAEKNHHLVVHELVHGSMRHWLGRVPAWVSEGLAEYVAAAQVKPGVYEFSNMEKRITRNIMRFNGNKAEVRFLGRHPKFWTASQSVWIRGLTDNGEGNYDRYATALLIVHSWMHESETGLATLQSLFEPNDSRRSNWEALEKWADRDRSRKLVRHLTHRWRNYDLRVR